MGLERRGAGLLRRRRLLRRHRAGGPRQPGPPSRAPGSSFQSPGPGDPKSAATQDAGPARSGYGAGNFRGPRRMRLGPRARRRPGGQIEPACRIGRPSRRPHALPQGRSASLFLSFNLPDLRVVRSGERLGAAAAGIHRTPASLRLGPAAARSATRPGRRQGRPVGRPVRVIPLGRASSLRPKPRRTGGGSALPRS